MSIEFHVQRHRKERTDDGDFHGNSKSESDRDPPSQTRALIESDRKSGSSTVKYASGFTIKSSITALLISTIVSVAAAQARTGEPPQYPFSPQVIARAGEVLARRLQERAIRSGMPAPVAAERADLSAGGAAGVSQGHYSNCWFEAAVAAFARLPEGQLALSRIITNRDGVYLVRFPDLPEKPFRVTEKKLRSDKVRDFALWARILDAAIAQRFSSYVDGDAKQIERGVPNAAQGLAILTASKPQFISTDAVGTKELAGIVEKYANAGVPMVAGTRMNRLGEGQVVVPGHSYTVLNFDPAHGVIVLRNPWGHNATNLPSRKYPYLTHVGEERRGVLDHGGGVISMTLDRFKQYYRCLAWTKIENRPWLDAQSVSPPVTKRGAKMSAGA